MQHQKTAALLVIALMTSGMAIAYMGFPPQTQAEPLCHDDGYTFWANKSLEINNTPVDLNYADCEYIGPIVDIPGTPQVNSTQNSPNNDATVDLTVSMGHISDVHEWYIVKNPTDYEVNFRLSVNTDRSINTSKIIQFTVFIGDTAHIVIYNGQIENNSIDFSLNPLEVEDVQFQIATDLSGKSEYSSAIFMEEYIQLVPSKTV